MTKNRKKILNSCKSKEKRNPNATLIVPSMDLQHIDMKISTKGLYSGLSSVFENLIQLAEQLFEIPIISICSLENLQLDYRYLKGVSFSKLPDYNPLAFYCAEQKELVYIPDFKKFKQLGLQQLQYPYSEFKFYCGLALYDDAGKLLGFFEVADVETRTLSEKQINQFQLIAKQIGEILKNENLLKSAKKQQKDSDTDNIYLKKVEDSVKEGEKNLLAIFNHAPTALFIARPSDGMIVMVNKELQKLAESSEIELIGKCTTDFYAKESDRVLFFSVMKEKGSVKNLEICVKKKDGSIANCLVSSEQIIYKGEPMLLTGFIDISDRKKSEQLLVQKEESFRSLYNRTPVMLHSLNENGDFLSVSDYWLAKLGYQRLQVIGKNISQFFTKASAHDSVTIRVPELKKRGYDFDIPYQVIKRNGEVMDVLVSTIIEKSHEDKEIRYLAVMQDVTERKKIDEALQKSEDNLRTIFENTNVGYALLDADMFIVSFNQAMQKFANDDLHKTLYLYTYSILYFAEARQPALTQSVNAVLQGKTISYEINYVQPNGDDRWYKMNMFPVFNKESIAVGVVMAIEDINESKLKEIHLNNVVKEISDYKWALDESSIVLITDSKGLITYANENCTTITQYSLAELLNQDLSFLDSGYHDATFFSDMWNTIQSGAIWKGEIRNKNKNGQIFWVDCTIVPFLDKDGKPYQYISIQRDITLTKNAEIELNKSFSLVNEQNKRLLNFSYIVSHNLRSHTSNIISILNFLEKEDSPTEKEELMQHLKRVSRSLNDTLFNLNEVVSIRNNINLVIEPLNLLEYIKQALRVLEEQIILKRVKIFNEVDKDIMVNYNPAYLESVLLNFISNAIKYSSPDRQAEILLKISHEDGELVLQICDNGIGIDLKKNGSKLFGMYKTFNNNSDARGIGLFITKNQIDAMGGRVEVESELGKGSIFKIFFSK